jgi:hypothetical protein
MLSLALATTLALPPPTPKIQEVRGGTSSFPGYLPLVTSERAGLRYLVSCEVV